MNKYFTLILIMLFSIAFKCKASELGDANPTTLPFNLVGVMIFQDQSKNLVTIEDKSDQKVYPLRENEEIPQKVKILKIESSKVIFLNQQSGRNEYIALQGAIIPRVSKKQ